MILGKYLFCLQKYEEGSGVSLDAHICSRELFLGEMKVDLAFSGESRVSSVCPMTNKKGSE